jgi:mRNA interferase HigB
MLTVPSSLHNLGLTLQCIGWRGMRFKQLRFSWEGLSRFTFCKLCIIFGIKFMRVIAKSTLRAFWEKHADAEMPLKTWYKITEKADWRDSHEVKKVYSDVSVIGSNRLVFNIKGNKYRLVVYVMFKFRKVFVRFVGTHQEYDRIDVKTV